MNAVINRIELSNGLNLPYVEQGDPTGAPVVFLHGLSDSWRSFEHVLPHLPKSIRALALTQRGHAEADAPEEGYLPKDLAADVAAFLDAHGIEKAIIVGHSMGSYVAQGFAIDHPERTLGIVLAGSFKTTRGNPVIEEFTTEVEALTDPVPYSFGREFQVSTLARPIADSQLETFIGETLKVPARVIKAAWRGLIEEDHSADVARIKAPVLLVFGRHDAFFPAPVQDALQAALPHAEVIRYEDAGHAMHWEEPQRFAADVTRFVESL